MQVAPLVRDDTTAALALYAELTFGPKALAAKDFHKVLDLPGTFVFGAKKAGALQAMLTLHILPNVTWGGRPYALIENVVTAASCQRRGIGAALMEKACDFSWKHGVYKIMLLTGSKRNATGFYEACGFSPEDKHAMVKRAPDA